MRIADKKGKNMLWVMIFIGAIGGNLIGEVIGNSFKALAFLKTSYLIGTSSPLILNLKVIVLTLGLNINLNIMSIICVILAIIILRK